MFIRALLRATFLVALAVSGMLAASGTISFSANDAITHFAVRTTVKLEGPESLSLEIGDTGGVTRALAPGEYRALVTALGYEEMKARVTVVPEKADSVGFMLTPLIPPEEERDLESRLRPGFTLLHGWVADERARPAPGVRVRLQKAGVEAVTDERGHYWLSAPTPPGSVHEGVDLPGTDDLIAEKPGYRTVIYRNIIVAGEDGGGWHIGMERGVGTVESDKTHKLMRKDAEWWDSSHPLGGTTRRARFCHPSLRSHSSSDCNGTSG